jgi:hypothetical protein
MNFRQQGLNNHASSHGYSRGSLFPNSNNNRRTANIARESQQPKEFNRRDDLTNTYAYSSRSTRSQRGSTPRLPEQPKASNKKDYLADAPSSSRSVCSQRNSTPRQQSGETSHSRHLQGSSAPQTNRKLTSNLFEYIFGPPPIRRDVFIILPKPENCLEQFAREMFDMLPTPPQVVIVDHLPPNYYPFYPLPPCPSYCNPKLNWESEYLPPPT